MTFYICLVLPIYLTTPTLNEALRINLSMTQKKYLVDLAMLVTDFLMKT